MDASHPSFLTVRSSGTEYSGPAEGFASPSADKENLYVPAWSIDTVTSGDPTAFLTVLRKLLGTWASHPPASTSNPSPKAICRNSSGPMRTSMSEYEPSTTTSTAGDMYTTSAISAAFLAHDTASSSISGRTSAVALDPDAAGSMAIITRTSEPEPVFNASPEAPAPPSYLTQRLTWPYESQTFSDSAVAEPSTILHLSVTDPSGPSEETVPSAEVSTTRTLWLDVMSGKRTTFGFPTDTPSTKTSFTAYPSSGTTVTEASLCSSRSWRSPWTICACLDDRLVST